MRDVHGRILPVLSRSQPVVKVQTAARMGIVRRAQGATTKAIPAWIVEEEQRRDRPHSGPCNLRRTDDGRAQQDPCALRVAAAGGPLRPWRPSTMHIDIACGPPPSPRRSQRGPLYFHHGLLAPEKLAGERDMKAW